MSGPARLRAALERIGGTAYLLAGPAETAFAASIQPDLNLRGEDASPLGVGRSRRAKLYAPAGSAAEGLEAGSRLRQGDDVYRVLQAQTVSLGNQALYVWAVLERLEVEA